MKAPCLVSTGTIGVLVLILGQPAFGQAEPGSPEFIEQTALDAVALAKSEQPAERLQVLLSIAERRRAGLEAAALRGDPAAVDDAEEAFSALLEGAQRIQEAARSRDVARVVEEATRMHLAALGEVLEKVPPQAQPAIRRAMEHSLRGNEAATAAIAGQTTPPPAPATPRPATPPARPATPAAPPPRPALPPAAGRRP